jgi:hypothetical protein
MAIRILALDARIVATSDDPRNWGPAKTTTMAAIAEGVDLANPLAYQAFIMRYNERMFARNLENQRKTELGVADVFGPETPYNRQDAKLLGTKRQTPHDCVKSDTLLGIEEKGRWLFPYWQFDPAGPNGVVDGLACALRALRTSAVAKANWFTLPNLYLEERTPIQALKDGDSVRVVDMARAVGTN